MQGNNFTFSLYRINIVDELSLFPSDRTPPLRNDDQIISVLKNSTDSKFDIDQSTQHSIYRWSARTFCNYGYLEGRGNIVSIVLARSVLEKEGLIVTIEKIVQGTSSSTPPLADTIILFFDLARHIVAVENNSALTRSKQWKKTITSILHSSAADLKYSSSIQLEEIPEKHEILKLFNSFELLTRLKVNLRIPNPELSRYTKKLYQDLQDGEIREYSQDMKNPGGMAKGKDARPYATASLAQAGYKEGEVLFEGFQNGEHVSIKSSEDAARGKIEVLKDYVRGIEASANTKEGKNILAAITAEIDRLHPQEQQ